MKNTCALYERRELTINAFKSRIFTLKSTQGKGLKILTLKQMFQWLAIVFAQIKQVTQIKLLKWNWNETLHIIYSLYWSKQITKEVYNNIMNSINV